jgi:hypothetical protein
MSHMRSIGWLMLGSSLLLGCSSGAASRSTTDSSGAASAATAAAADDGDGFHFTYRGTATTTGGPVQGSQTPRDYSATVRIRGGKARVDFASEMGRVMRKGSYMLVDAASRQVMIVLPEEKRIITMDSAGGSLTKAMRGVMTMAVTDTSSRVEDLGAGETVLGFTTRKYRVTRAYTMRMTMMGRSTDIRHESVATIHMSRDIDALDPAFDAFARSFTTAMGTGAGEGDAMTTIGALNKGLPKGFAVLQEEESRSTSAGSTTVTRTTWRVTDFGRGGVDAGDLAAPEGYAKGDMMSMQRRGGNAMSRPPAMARP